VFIESESFTYFCTGTGHINELSLNYPESAFLWKPLDIEIAGQNPSKFTTWPEMH